MSFKPNKEYRFNPNGNYVPRVGNRIKIKNFAKKYNGKLAYITKIDGGYIFVRLKRTNYIIELYDCEIDPEPYE